MARKKGRKKASTAKSSPATPATREGATAARSNRRFWVSGLAIPQAVLFGAAAFYLPWSTFTAFTALALLVAVGHVGTAVLGLIGHARWTSFWRAQCFASLALIAYLTWVVVASATHISALYGHLGDGVAAALAAAWAPAALVTVPGAIWGLVSTRGLGRAASITSALVLGSIFVVSPIRWAWETAGATLVDEVPASSLAELEALSAELPGTATAAPALRQLGPVACESDLEQSTTWVATFATLRGGVTSSCVQGATLEEATEKLGAALKAQARAGPIKLDLLRRAQTLGPHPPLVASFLLRPGLDGLCLEGRCLMPWQLIALDEFNSYQPVDFIGDLRLGVDPAKLRRRLGQKLEKNDPRERSFDGLVRVASHSFLIGTDGKARALRRLRAGHPSALEPASLARAIAGARAFVLGAQAEDGRFMYKIDPFSGQVSYSNFSVARQAGTTLALCELGGTDAETRRVAMASLDMLASLMQTQGELGGLIYPKGAKHRYIRMGSSALSAIAFLKCREVFGDDKHDEVIARLGRFLMALQREDGSFRPSWDLEEKAPEEGPHSLYADGQAVFALVLFESLQERLSTASLPALASIRDSVERAMEYTATEYWGHPARQFFFIEENWHCLAARAALEVHRHEGYERFCIDYVTFKTRYMFTPESDVFPEYVGAYSFSSVTVPYNTPTAGFAEAMSAAIDVMNARGDDVSEHSKTLARAMGYLVYSQWHEQDCFACTESPRIPGAFSESLSSPTIRIDYVQHAWAGLGHGARALGLLEDDPA